MTSGTHAHAKVSPASPTPPRFRLKPQASATGYLDGAWWPRSRDLAAELADVAADLADRMGRIERVAYALSAWNAAPRRVELKGFRVRLEGFTYQDRNLIHVTGANGGRISLLVIPPETTANAGREALMIAGHPDNTDHPTDILVAASLPAP